MVQANGSYANIYLHMLSFPYYNLYSMAHVYNFCSSYSPSSLSGSSQYSKYSDNKEEAAFNRSALLYSE